MHLERREESRNTRYNLFDATAPSIRLPDKMFGRYIFIVRLSARPGKEGEDCVYLRC